MLGHNNNIDDYSFPLYFSVFFLSLPLFISLYFTTRYQHESLTHESQRITNHESYRQRGFQNYSYSHSNQSD